MKKLIQFLGYIDGADLGVLLLILGIALLGYGASQFHHGLGPVLVGLILIAYVRPVKGWWG